MQTRATETTTESPVATPEEARAFFAEVHTGLSQGRLAPYLGPGVCASAARGLVPSSYDELAAFFAKRVALPRRARSNPWAAAQYVEGQRHRSSVTKLMTEAFQTPVSPGPVHAYLASLGLPLIVDTWYDGAMRSALAQRDDWLELQGITRAGIAEFLWYRAYTPEGEECSVERAIAVKTLLYKPHGGITPSKNFLISDADYVEVLTEIDIQTPLPPVLRERRTGLGFVLLGCHFHDQLLRSYARQILKRTAGPHYAVVDASQPSTRNELKFLRELGARILVLPLASALEQLTQPTASARR